MTDIASIWDRVHRWLNDNAPEIAEQLRPPATGSAIERTESQLALSLPDDYRASVLVHDGSANPSGDFGLLEGYVLYSLDKVVRTRELMRRLRQSGDIPSSLDRDARPEPGVRQAWWHDAWIPIAADTVRVLVCLDLDPAPGGTVGQLVLYISDVPDRKVIAPSFAQWLERVAGTMEAGEVVAKRDDSDGSLVGLRGLADSDDEDERP